MAEGYDPFAYKSPEVDANIDDDDNTNTTQPFISPYMASTPYHKGEEYQMQTISHEQSGIPSFDETAHLLSPEADLERRLSELRFNSETGLLNTSKTPDSFASILNQEFKENQIKKVKELILKRYPHANADALVITYSRKKPMELVALGPKGGETKIVLADGSDLQRSFISKDFVKKNLGPPAETLIQKQNEEIRKKQKELKDLRNSEKLLSEKNEEIERLNERLNMEQAKVDQLKEGEDNEAEIQRKKKLVKSLENDLKSKKKDVKELGKK